MAPELFEMHPKYSKQSDVYAHGVILWEITTQKIPYEEVEERELREGIKRGEREEIPSNSLLGNIIKGCWKQKAEERMDLENVLYLLNEIRQQIRVENKLISGTEIVRQEEEKVETVQKKKKSCKFKKKVTKEKCEKIKSMDRECQNKMMEINKQNTGQKIQNQLIKNSIAGRF